MYEFWQSVPIFLRAILVANIVFLCRNLVLIQELAAEKLEDIRRRIDNSGW